jgi:hypothetical protein
MLESKVEGSVCDYAKKAYGFISYKFTSPARRSVPDRLFIGPGGLHFFIEFKAPGKLPTPKQVREITRLINLGHLVYVIDNIGTGKQLVDTLVSAPYLAPAPSATPLPDNSYQASTRA